MKKFKNFIKNKYFIFTSLGLILGALFFGFGLLWSMRFDLIGFIDALTLATLLLFALTWFLYVANHGLFDLVIYGTQQFFRGLAGKRMPMSFFEYTTSKRKTPKNILISFTIAGGVYALALIILFLIYVL